MLTPCFKEPETWLSKDQKKIARAKEGCNGCPIKVQCLADCLDYEALAGTTKLGTYGGLTEAERNNLPKAG